MSLSLFGLEEESIVDGPGIRLALFVQGCPHHCPGCHNPESWPFEGGHPMEPETIVELVLADPLVKGVTFSGGEPFEQASELARLARLLKARGKEVACYTGYTLEALTAARRPDWDELLAQVDVLVDGPFLQEQFSLELAFRGSRNQRILNMAASRAAGAPVWEQSRRWLLNETH